MDRLRKLIHEVHRRSLWQVLGIYVLASWVVLQVVGELTDATSLPEWFPALAVGLLLVGLPIVLATAFVQEGAPERAEQGPAEPAPGASSPTSSRIFTWRNALGGGVVAFALLGFFGLGWVLLGGGVPATAPAEADRSVAVLPFVNMSGDPDNEYFSDGVTEELLNQVARIPDLRVPARTSSFVFKGQAVPIREIADALDVAFVLEGSVRRAGDRVLITAQLVDAATDSHVWSETYERELSDVFGIQREIATAIAGELSVELGGTSLLAEATPTTSQAAHDLYLRGRYQLNQRNIPEAIDYFEQAIAEDPEYAHAHGGLALAGVLAFAYGASEPGLMDRALEAADRALELDSTLSEPHTARGDVPYRIGGLAASEQELRTALRLDPNDANAHQFLARALAALGRTEEALASATRAILVDPSNAAHHWTRGMLHYTEANLAEAETDLREALRREPGNAFARGLLAATLIAADRLDEAEEFAPPGTLRGARLIANPQTRDEGFEQMLSMTILVAIQGAIVTAVQYDRLDVAMELAERYFRGATATNRGFVPYIIARSSWLEPLRSDPRFQEILERMGIEGG